ncbi:hypothetical protein [Loktanella fryxellensis]|nr:hypothetical protein [Loktanella fryxellensis]
MRVAALLLALFTLAACTPARVVGNTAIGAGQVALGAADLAI